METSPIVCYAALRSGSTMLRIMLDAHPGLSCLGETDFLFDHVQRGPDGVWRYDREAMAASRIFRASSLVCPEGLDGRAAFDAMIGQIAARGGGRPVLMAHRNFDRIAELLPEAPVVRLKRDPRDVARSAIGMGWAGNTYFGLDRWLRTEDDWTRGAPAHRGPVHELRYEDLVAEPERRLGALCAFLGLPYDPAMLAYAGRTSYEAPDPKYAFQWRARQTPEEVGLVEGRLGARLESYGYAPSGHPPIRPGAARRLALWVENRVGVWRWLVARYGLPLLVRRGVGRRLGLKGLARSAQARIDEIAVRHLK